jgi:hypothetical protein
MSQFYLTLPSDSSSKFYPENTTASFITRLCERIHLDGEYEVGLCELIYPHSWYNFNNEADNIFLHFGENPKDCILDSGEYKNEQSLIATVNSKLNSDKNLFKATFVWNATTRKIQLFISEDYRPLYMSEDFKTLFGFDKIGPYMKGTHNATHAFDINASMHYMYVYSDIATYTFVGDSKVPLLRVCYTEGEYGDMVRTIFTHPQYVSVAVSEFETVEININNELGKPVPFEFGKAVVTLHFRRKNKLLL